MPKQSPIVTRATRLADRNVEPERRIEGVFIDNVLVGWGPCPGGHNDLFSELVGDWSGKPYGRAETLAWLRDINGGETDQTYRFGDGTPW